MKKPRYYFYLNPHDEYKFTKCPKCDCPTRVRKHCLMIHYQEKHKNLHRLISLNKSGKFCPHCQLIISQKSELEELLKQLVPQLGLSFKVDNYFLFGTMDRKDWTRNQQEPLHPKESLKLIHPFKDTWDFEVRPAGWYFEG